MDDLNMSVLSFITTETTAVRQSDVPFCPISSEINLLVMRACVLILHGIIDGRILRPREYTNQRWIGHV